MNDSPPRGHSLGVMGAANDLPPSPMPAPQSPELPRSWEEPPEGDVLLGPAPLLGAVLCLPLLAVPCQCPLMQASEVPTRTSPKPGECLGFHVHLT